MSNNALISSQGRVFIRLPDGQYTYYGNAKLSGLSKSYGESAPIYDQDPARGGRFVISGRIPNTEENFWTTTMVGRVSRDSDSQLALAAENRCEIDLQVHYGLCNDPTDFSDYESAWVIEGVRISQYQTTDLVAREPKDTALIDETVNLSASSAYRILERRLSLGGISSVNGAIADLLITKVGCSSLCDLHGCGRLYALIVDNSPGPTTAPLLHVAWSDNNGVTFHTVDITIANVDYNARREYASFKLGATKDYLIIFNPGLTYGANDGILAFAHTDFVASASPLTPVLLGLDSGMVGRFVFGGSTYYPNGSGWLYRIGNNLVPELLYTPTAGLMTLEGAIDGIDGDNLIYALREISGADQFLVVRVGGGPFIEIPVDTSTPFFNVPVTIYSVAMLTPTRWLLGCGHGELLETLDGGQTWTLIRVFGDAALFDTDVFKIEMVTANIGYLITRRQAAVYRTIDGGRTWSLLRTSSAWPLDGANNKIELMAAATCGDPNVLFVGGADSPVADSFHINQQDVVATLLGQATE